MTTVRISSNWGHPQQMAWCGAPAIDDHDHLERSLEIPDEAYQKIEAGIAHGYVEGAICLDDGSRFQWFLDGPRPSRRGARAANRTTVPTANRPAAEPVKGKAVHAMAATEKSELLDVADQPGAPMVHPTGDFQSGWVLGEFPAAHPDKSAKCKECGQPLPEKKQSGKKTRKGN